MYADAVPYPVATSFAVEVYRILPNDTDFTVFRKSGRFTGLNSAYIDGSAVYHSPEDQASYMDVGSLQQNGANALALTRAFGRADLATLRKPSADDSTYFPALGFLVRYPGMLVWPIAALTIAAVGALAVIVRRRGLAGWGRMAAGFGLGLIPIIVAPVLTQLLWTLLVAVRPGYTNMIDPWQPGWYRAGVVALVATVVLTWYALLRRRFGTWALTVGGARLAGAARHRARRRNARRLLPGRAARARRSRRRHRRAVGSAGLGEHAGAHDRRRRRGARARADRLPVLPGARPGHGRRGRVLRRRCSGSRCCPSWTRCSRDTASAESSDPSGRARDS